MNIDLLNHSYKNLSHMIGFSAFSFCVCLAVE